MKVILPGVLFFVILANLLQGLPLLFVPDLGFGFKWAPLLMAAGAFTSAVGVFLKLRLTFLPYFLALAIFLISNAPLFGMALLTKAAIGIGIGMLFFVPSIRSPKWARQPQ